MKNTYFIYIRKTREKIQVTKEQHDTFYREADRIRHKEQYHGRCICPRCYIWKCDGDCFDCEYHTTGDIISLDRELKDEDITLSEFVPDNSRTTEEIVEDRLLLERLFARLRDLDPQADTIIRLWIEHPEGISDREIARELGRPQKTFSDQMKRYRSEMRRICEKIF